MKQPTDKQLIWTMILAIAGICVFTVIGLVVIDAGEFNEPAPAWMNIPCMVLACVFLIALFWMLLIWVTSKQEIKHPAGVIPKEKKP